MLQEGEEINLLFPFLSTVCGEVAAWQMRIYWK